MYNIGMNVYENGYDMTFWDS